MYNYIHIFNVHYVNMCAYYIFMYCIVLYALHTFCLVIVIVILAKCPPLSATALCSSDALVAPSTCRRPHAENRWPGLAVCTSIASSYNLYRFSFPCHNFKNLEFISGNIFAISRANASGTIICRTTEQQEPKKLQHVATLPQG